MAPRGNVVSKVKQVRTSISKRCGGRCMWWGVYRPGPSSCAYTTCMHVLPHLISSSRHIHLLGQMWLNIITMHKGIYCTYLCNHGSLYSQISVFIKCRLATCILVSYLIKCKHSFTLHMNMSGSSTSTHFLYVVMQCVIWKLGIRQPKYISKQLHRLSCRKRD